MRSGDEAPGPKQVNFTKRRTKKWKRGPKARNFTIRREGMGTRRQRRRLGGVGVDVREGLLPKHGRLVLRIDHLHDLHPKRKSK